MIQICKDEKEIAYRLGVYFMLCHYAEEGGILFQAAHEPSYLIEKHKKCMEGKVKEIHLLLHPLVRPVLAWWVYECIGEEWDFVEESEEKQKLLERHGIRKKK